MNPFMTAHGRITSDAEIKALDSGMNIITFSIACNKKIKGEDQTIFVNCAWFRKDPGNVAGYLRKGALVSIQGEPSPDAYMAKDGSIKKSLRCNVQQLEILVFAKDGSQPESVTIQPQGDDLPF